MPRLFMLATKYRGGTPGDRARVEAGLLGCLPDTLTPHLRVRSLERPAEVRHTKRPRAPPN
jgi:hypothetical protein